MPPFAQLAICTDCFTSITTPKKRKCRTYHSIRPQKGSINHPSTTRRALQERNLNTSSTRAQTSISLQSKPKIWFRSSAYEPEPTPPSRYQDNGENGITPAGYQLSSELQKAFCDNALRRQKTTAAQFQREAQRSPVLRAATPE
jgi:hypothetical protein